MPLANSPEQPLPLRIVVGEVKKWIERLGAVWVEGQVVEVTRRRGTYSYLTLRDKLADASVSVSITSATLDAAAPLADGATVAAHLKPVMFTSSGRLMFDCLEIRPVGIGRLLAQLEQTKRRLAAEGLFDPLRKRPLPFLPRRIGLITGAGSAAERDVVINVHDRWPGAAFETVHTQVQGPSAAAQVMEAVARLDAHPEVDVIVIARGGGSFEDLLPFSDEGLLRVVFACRTPVVSAIGHEVDTPLLDHVADLRATTPTDAAKRVVPDVREQTLALTQLRQRLRHVVAHRLDAARMSLDALRGRPVMRDPTGVLTLHEERLDAARTRLRRAVTVELDSGHADVRHALERLRALSPRQTLARGYAIVTTGDGHTVTTVDQVSTGDPITAILSRGRIAATVTGTSTADRDATNTRATDQGES